MREDHRHLIEVHVAGVCFRETERRVEVLMGKRVDTRALYPGFWECGGGQVCAGESLSEAINRQMREEFGVEIDFSVPFGTYTIPVPDLPQKVIPGVKSICFWKGYANGATDIVIDGTEHSEAHWQAIDDLGAFDFIPGMLADIRTGWEFYHRYRRIFEERKGVVDRRILPDRPIPNDRRRRS